MKLINANSAIVCAATTVALTLFTLPSRAQGLPGSMKHLRWAAVTDSTLEVLDAVSANGASTFGGGTLAASVGTTSLVWRLDSDGTWIAETVGIGNHGTQIFTEYGSFLNEVALLSGHAEGVASAAWNGSEANLNFVRQVASSSEADIHLSVHQEYTDSSNTARRAVLRCFSSSSSSALWTFNSDAVISNHTHSWAGISADGQTIALLVYDSSQGSTRATFFAPDSGQPLSATSLSTLGGFKYAELSADGSTLLVSAPFKQLVYDVSSQSVALSVLTLAQSQYGGVALSGNGGRVVFGTPGDFTVYSRDEQGIYSEAYVHELSPGHIARSLALSADGGTLVAAIHKISQLNDTRILAVDLTTSTTLLDFVLSGAGGFQNLVQRIECSSDGSRFAMGMWGDEQNLVPEVLVYGTDSAVPMFADHLQGSVNDLSFSSNGEWLAVASKGTHANVWGGGGSISLYRIGLVDFYASGLPSLGATISLEHHVREGSNSKVLVSTGLLTTPIMNSSYGTGALYLDPAGIVELPSSLAGSDNVAKVQYTLPGLPADIGTTLYMQAVDLDGGTISADWVPLTILP